MGTTLSKNAEIVDDLFNAVEQRKTKFYNGTTNKYNEENCRKLFSLRKNELTTIVNENAFHFVINLKVASVFNIEYAQIKSSDEKTVFYFIPLKRFLVGNRTKIQLMSYKEINGKKHPSYNIFTIYASTSSGSIWRYCEYDDDIGHLNKGFDYISNTFIHIKLQLFINKYIQTIPYDKTFIECIAPIFSDDIKNELTDIYYQDCKRTIINNTSSYAKRNYEFIYGKTRIVDDEVFRPLRKVMEAGAAFQSSLRNQIQFIIGNIQEISRRPGNSFNPANASPTNEFSLKMKQITTSRLSNSSNLNKFKQVIRETRGNVKLTDNQHNMYLVLLREIILIYKEYISFYFEVYKQQDQPVYYYYPEYESTRLKQIDVDGKLILVMWNTLKLFINTIHLKYTE